MIFYYLKAVWFCVLMLFVPTGVGALFFSKEKRLSAETYLMGLCVCFSAYEVLGLFCSMVLETSLTVLTATWSALVGLLSIGGWYGLVKNSNAIKAQRCTAVVLSGTGKIGIAIFFLLVALQTIRAVTGQVVNNDDAFYCAQATTAVYTNTVNQYVPFTGVPTNPRTGYYYIALWPILWASMSQLTSLHPAIVMRTLLPIFMIPGAYASVYVVCKKLFNDCKEKAYAAVCILALIYEVVGCNDGMKQWWLLLLSWYGKSVAPNLIFPFLVYLFLCQASAETKEDQNKYWLMVLFTCMAGCLVAVSFYPMLIFAMGILSVSEWIRKKDWSIFPKAFICVLPCMVLLVWSYSVGVY